MIIREYEEKYEWIKQHDHGLLSGEMAYHAGNPPFAPVGFRNVLTAALHDISWVHADDEPFEEFIHFNDYPLSKRLPMYEAGIDDMEAVDPFTALLTSLHYSAFFKPGKTDKLDAFLEREHNRQTRLKRLFPTEDLNLALKQLKMWDNLSLYVCLNKPGTTKENEHPWYKNGIQGVTASGSEMTIEGYWRDEHTVTFSPFPFKTNWTAEIPVYECRKPFDKLELAREPMKQTVTFKK